MRLKRKIEEVEYLRLSAFRYLFGSAKNRVFEDIPGKVLFTGTGRAALRIILEHYTNNKTLHDRNDQVLIPRWLCQSAIYTMHRFCTPTLTIDKNLKGVMPYHQYGFPQKMDEITDFCQDKDLFLIEDCANVFESHYKGKHLGTFGDAAIFSFSKLFPSILGGALITNDVDLYEYGKQRLRNGNKNLSHLTYKSRILWECFKDTSLNEFFSAIQEMVYGKTDSAFKIKNISLRIVNKQLLNGAMERRKENYRFILEYFNDRPDYFKDLERKGVIPYIVPLFDKEENLKKMVKSLREKNVITGIYHFDVNRNMLNPNFKKCIWIPMHQGLDQDTLELICKTIKNIH